MGTVMKRNLRIRGECIGCPHMKWKEGRTKRKYYCDKYKHWITFSSYGHYNRCLIEENCPYGGDDNGKHINHR